MDKQNYIVNMMIWELREGFQELVDFLKNISKKEAQWKPSSRSRTIKTIKQWNKKGNDWIAEQRLDPISTIEYKVIHLAQCKLMYDNFAFRDGTLNWSDLECLEWPHCNDQLEKSQTRLLESIQILSDKQLDELVSTNWGEFWPTKQIILSMIQHDIYHLGQMCTIKRLYDLKYGKTFQKSQ
ncbi:MAG: hypothetical protein ACXAC8_16800 [Candidatus Hodarchaeales archaeon]|jgi:uncharacterized damage-inducible protein DinB